MPVTDLFAPAVPEEHALYEKLQPVLQYLFSPVPPRLQNSRYFYQEREQPSFPWSIQLDGPPGSGKTALLKCLTRNSLLFYLPERPPINLDILHNRQIDEQTFVSALHAQADKLLNVQHMTATSSQMERKFQIRKSRRFRATLDSQLLKKKLPEEVIDIIESPLQQNQKQLSILSVDDCQYFYLSDMEMCFDTLYRGGQIRPLVFANNSGAMGLRRHLLTGKNGRYKSCPMLSYCFSNIWREETLSCKDTEHARKPVAKGRIDAFLNRGAGQAATAPNQQATEPCKPMGYLRFGSSAGAMGHYAELSKYHQPNFYNNRVCAETLQLARYDTAQRARALRLEPDAARHASQLEINILDRPFYSIRSTKDHLTPIPANGYFDMLGGLSATAVEGQPVASTGDSGQDTGCKGLLDKEIAEHGRWRLLETCAREILIACIFYKKLCGADDVCEHNIAQMVRGREAEIDHVYSQLLGIVEEPSGCINLRKVCNYAHLLRDVMPGGVGLLVDGLGARPCADGMRNLYYQEAWLYVHHIGREECLEYLYTYNILLGGGYVCTGGIVCAEAGERALVCEYLSGSLYGGEIAQFRQLDGVLQCNIR